LLQQQAELEDKLNDVEVDKQGKRAELDYIKREDMLDETGRTKPILIESESKLIERLQINEFLYSVQQTRNPLPMLIEKVSHVLELLHTAHTQSDQYLQDLQRSNGMLTALRHKNMTLYEKVQMCETWKMKALLKIASNEFEQRTEIKGHKAKAKKDENYKLYLDGLQYSNKELKELHRVIESYGKAAHVRELHLQDNALDLSSVDRLIDILELCPYITLIDVRRNKIPFEGIGKLKCHVERIPGVTRVEVDPVTENITALSGAQVRLQINCEEQAPCSGDDPMASPNARDDLFADGTGDATDAFLASGPGLLSQKVTGPAAQGYPGARDKTILAPQRGGTSTAKLPTIPGASARS